MELALMRFKGFTLWCNPLSIEVTSEKNTADYILPYSGERFEDLGGKCRVIKGKGELKGKDCLEQYAKLYSLQAKGGEGVLSLPTMEPVLALFTKLTAEASVTPDKISYTFQFTEIISEEPPKAEKIHKVIKGETLFDIAYKYGVEADVLVELNPCVKRPDELNENQVIKIC